MTSPYLSLFGSLLLVTIAAIHAVNGFVTGNLGLYFVEEPYTWISHPIVYSILMLLTVFVLAVMLRQAWIDLQRIRRKG